jgi:hypothetical protein
MRSMSSVRQEAMTDFTRQDLRGSRFEHVDLSGSEFR